jgi:hypothetical protein
LSLSFASQEDPLRKLGVVHANSLPESLENFLLLGLAHAFALSGFCLPDEPPCSYSLKWITSDSLFKTSAKYKWYKINMVNYESGKN